MEIKIEAHTRLQAAVLPAYVAPELRRRGFKLLGEGKSSQVWLPKGSNEVLKISLAHDKPTARFVKFCQQHKANPYLPKISRSAVSSDGKLRMIYIERLKPASLIVEHAVQMVFDTVYYKKPTRGTLLSIKRDRLKLADVEALASTYKPIIPLVKQLIKIHGRIDAAYTNVMLRGSTPVLVDPWTE